MTIIRLSVNVQTPSATFAGQVAGELASQFPLTPAWSSELSTPRYLGVSTLNSPVPSQGDTGPLNFVPFKAPNSSYSDVAIGWTGKSSYHDARGGEVWYSGGTTGRSCGTQTLVRYSLSNNEWRHWQGNSAFDRASSCFDFWGAPHNFGAASLFNGKLYREMPEQTDNRIPGFPAPPAGSFEDRRAVAVWDTATKTGTVIRQPFGLRTGTGTYPPLEIFPEMGAAGSIVILWGGNPAKILSYDFNTQTWRADIDGPMVGADIGPVIYHNGEIYFAQGFYGTEFYRMTWNGSTASFQTLASPGIAMPNGGENGIVQFELVSLGGYIYAFGNRAIHRFDPEANGRAGAWTMNYDQFSNMLNNKTDHGFTIAAIPALGAVMFTCTKGVDVPYLQVNTSESQLWRPGP
jgi:hypothetical protein